MKLLTLLPFLAGYLFALPVMAIPRQVSTEGSQPQLAISPTGVIHVAYGVGERGSVCQVQSADGGKTFSEPVEIGRLPDLALGMGRGPQIAVADGSLLVTAISHKDGMIQLWRRKDGAGEVWKEEASINDTPGSAKEGLHAMAANTAGKVAVVWLDARSGKTEIWISVSENSGEKWNGNTLVYRSPDGTVCECCRPSVAVGEDGRVAVMWRNWLDGARDMYLSEIAKDGTGFTEAQKLGTGAWKLKGCPMDGGSVGFDKDGKIVTAWRREKSSYTASPGSAETLVSANAVRPFMVSTGDDNSVFYESKGNVIMKKDDGKNPEAVAKNAAFPAAAPVPGKGIILIWESNQAGKPGIFAELIVAP